MNKTLRVVPSSAHPDNLAIGVTNGGVQLTHKQLAECCATLSEQLREWGIKPSEPVAIVIPNTIEFVVCYIGTTWSRAVAAPLNSAYKADEFKFYLEDADCKLVIVPPEGNNAAEEAAAELKIPTCTAAWNVDKHCVILSERKGFANGKRPRVESGEPQPNDFAMYLHTSGTTSKPKCVQLTHLNLVTTLCNIERTYKLCPTDRTFLVMPLFHVHGLMSATLTTLFTGGAVIMPSEGRFSASTFWAGIQQFKCTWYTAVPTIHQILLVRADKEFPGLSNVHLRFIRSCSSSLAPAVMTKLEETFGAPVLEAYAMTEAAHQMTSNPLPEEGPHKAGTVGKPTGVQLTILDPQCSPVPCGQPGEVCIRGDNVTPGYRNRPEANVEAFAGNWFHTGDQGFLDSDGYLTLTGRIKELINRGGEKISPLEVDAVLLANPAVAEAVSFGAPDPMYGEEVHAVVILKPGQVATSADIMAFCKERLAAFKVPKVIHISNDMPRTATGKIQRRIIAAHFNKQ